ncbi:recombinase family protein [Bacillus sp. EB600]|uniref:recombinase family protein n=1 Tax=Bacillus sp. EB600 TaxID=2806345 RepID=UPI00210AEF27|nr:recombinase family protein [Bacillus sp. EB600]
MLFSEKESGGKEDRKVLKKGLDQLQQGDTFVIYKLDRLARSTKQLDEIHENLEKRGVIFVSLSDSIDTNTAIGKAMFGMIAVFAARERATDIAKGRSTIYKVVNEAGAK